MGNLIVGILFLIGGLTGNLVLRGTTSSIAVAVLGFVLCIVGIIQLNHKPSAKSRLKTRSRTRGSRTGRMTRGGRDGRTTLPMTEPVRQSRPTRGRSYSSSR